MRKNTWRAKAGYGILWLLATAFPLAAGEDVLTVGRVTMVGKLVEVVAPHLRSLPAGDLQRDRILSRLEHGVEMTILLRSEGPQVTIKLPPLPDNLGELRMTLNVMGRDWLSPILVKFLPEGSAEGRYIDNELPFQEARTLAFKKTGVDNPMELILDVSPPPFVYRIGLVGLEAVGTDGKALDLLAPPPPGLASGWNFESDGDMGDWTAVNGAECSRGAERRSQGDFALKAVFAAPDSAIRLAVDERDWRGFKELRVHAMNPHIAEQGAKFAHFTLTDGAGRSARLGTAEIGPEQGAGFRFPLEAAAGEVDLGDVRTLAIHNDAAETTLFFDQLRLFRAEDIRHEAGAGMVPLFKTQDRLRRITPPEGSPYRASLEAWRRRLDDYAAAGRYEDGAERLALTAGAGELATVLECLGRHDLAPDAPMLLLSADPTEKIFRDTPFAAAPGRTLLSARREYESFQLVAIPARPLKGVSVSATPLTGPGGAIISSENVTINPVGYVEVPRSYYYQSSRPGYWPEILVHNQPVDMEERLQPWWITVYTPPGQAAGVYRGELEVASADAAPLRFPYQLEVRAVELPLHGELKTFFDLRYRPDDPAIRRRVYDLFLSHRMNPTGMYLNGNAPSRVEEYEFMPHPDDLRYCRERGMNFLVLWNLLNGADKADPHAFDEAYRDKVDKFLEYYVPLLDAADCRDISMFTGFDEIMHVGPAAERERQLGEARNLCAWLKKRHPWVKINNVGSKMDISTDLMDYWFGATLKDEDIRAAGGHTGPYWVYNDPSPMLDLPGMAARILGWQAWASKASGIAYYSTYRPWALLLCPLETVPTGVDWPASAISVETTAPPGDGAHRPGRNGDGNLLYPARDGSLLSSVRWENLRDGVEDFELLALLRAKNPKHPLLTIPPAIWKFTTAGGEYPMTQRPIDEHRRRVLDALKALP